MELAYKEDLFLILSMNMEVEEALKETERISNNFKKAYSPKQSHLQPIVGNDTYRFKRGVLVEKGWDMWWESYVDKYVNGEWKRFMKFKGEHSQEDVNKCMELVNRLKLGGNTVIEY